MKRLSVPGTRVRWVEPKDDPDRLFMFTHRFKPFALIVIGASVIKMDSIPQPVPEGAMVFTSGEHVVEDEMAATLTNAGYGDWLRDYWGAGFGDGPFGSERYGH